ncbi:zinc knuckle CX2CX4HX4C containing protein [Tanacetum coccineum]
MDKVDPAIATKSLANDFNNFISKLNSGVVDTKSADVISSGWEDPSIHGVKEGGIIKDGLGGDSGPVSNVPSFAKIVQDKLVKKVVKITEMRNSEVVDGASVAIPLEVVEEVSSRFANTLYGYFIGKRLAFLLVENYVKNTWAKYGLKRIQLHEEFFLFQFDSKEDMESVMEHGPWLIRLVPLMLNV